MMPIPNQSSCSGSPLSTPADQSPPVGRGNNDQRAGHHGLIAPKPGDEVGNHFSDQPGLVAFIGVNGGVEPFKFIDFRPFHKPAR